MGLSTRALKLDSPDPDSKVVTCGFHRLHRVLAPHCWTGNQALLRTAAGQGAARIWIEATCVATKWSLDPDLRSALDPDLRSCVESPSDSCLMHYSVSWTHNIPQGNMGRAKLSCDWSLPITCT